MAIFIGWLPLVATNMTARQRRRIGDIVPAGVSYPILLGSVTIPAPATLASWRSEDAARLPLTRP
jgi:hypothetical protein